MLSEAVLKIDVCRYLEDNWPLDDEDLDKMHRNFIDCSRWVFQILGERSRRPLPACVYTRIRERFASHDGLYTHFKYAKNGNGKLFFVFLLYKTVECRLSTFLKFGQLCAKNNNNTLSNQ